MIHLNFCDLSEEAQERLLENSRKDVEKKYGEDIKAYAKEYNTNFQTLMDEQAMRNLFNYDYLFKI